MKECGKYRNEIRIDPHNSNMYSIWTVPTFAIGQRAILIRTPSGNILWDCVSYIDNETIEKIKNLGGIGAIVISHPHFYTTHIEWAKIFNCEVYISEGNWLARKEATFQHVLSSPHTNDSDELIFYDGAIIIKRVGGHFPGSLVLYWKPYRKLLTADSIMVVPSGQNHFSEEMVSFSFMWSYPNMIPLDPDSILGIWRAVKHFDFEDCHSAWWNRDVRGNANRKVLYSAQTAVKFMGHKMHEILTDETA